MLDAGGVVLAICGGYQLLGEYYQMGDTRVDGLGVLDIRTKRGNRRMIGNVAIQTDFLKNPHLCDYILDVAIKGKWPEYELVSLDDGLEWEANEYAQNLRTHL